MSEPDKAKEAEAPPPPAASKLPLILALVNSLTALGAAGLLFYTQLIYKRPVITEESERKRLAELHATPKAPPVPGSVDFEPTLINIASQPGQIRPADGSTRQIQGKLHYVTMGFSLEIRDVTRKGEVEELKPLIKDRIISILGRKQFHELNTVQGRYILKTQLLDAINLLIEKRQEKPPILGPLVTQFHFTHFVAQ